MKGRGNLIKVGDRVGKWRVVDVASVLEYPYPRFTCKAIRRDRIAVVKGVSRQAPAEVRHRLDLEARAMSLRCSPHLAELIERSDTREWSLIAYEWIHGLNVHTYRLTTHPDGRLASAALNGVLAALAELHGAGLLHRDVKPANIVISEHRVVLVDYGLVASARARRRDGILGSPAFRAPEVVLEGSHSESSDIYSAFATTAFLMTGLIRSSHLSRWLEAVDGHDDSVWMELRNLCREGMAEPGVRICLEAAQQRVASL